MEINKNLGICFGIFFILILMIGNAFAGSEKNSIIYEDRIVWQDDSNGSWNIQMYNISTSKITQITNDKAEHQNPDIYRDRIVWETSRDGNSDIYMHDLLTHQENRITSSGKAYNPAIYGNKIIWEDSRNGNWDIYVYDIFTSTETQITHNISDETGSDIYQDKIVWVEGGAVYLYNLSTSKETQIAPHWWGWNESSDERGVFNRDCTIYGNKIACPTENEMGEYRVTMYDIYNKYQKGFGKFDSSPSSPAIYGNNIVWAEAREYEANWYTNIFVYDLSTQKQTQISTSGKAYYPSIYGNLVTWTDGRNAVTYNDTSDIYLYDISTSKEVRLTTVAEEKLAQGKEFRITTNKGEQELPAIYGNRIVWRDWRNGNEHDFVNGDIYMYGISGSEESQLTPNKSTQFNPDIYNDKIVWADDRNGNWDIYMYNASTTEETQITTNKSDQFDPVIYENRIVWLDQRNGYPNNDIYMYDLSTHKETQITMNESWQANADIYGDKIIWEDLRNGDEYDLNVDIFMYDISTSKEIQITTETSYQRQPAIYGDKIIWVDDHYNGKWNIYLYDLSTSKKTQIITGQGDTCPQIYKDIIVWDENRKVDAAGWGQGDIYMYNLSDKTESRISTSGLAIYPAIYENKIVWEDRRNGDPDIYMFILGDSKPTVKPPVANFTTSPLSGKVPLKVKFTSTSEGAPTEWKWNFGDGSPLSMEQNPEHTYTKAGTYTVKHTAINGAGRDTEIKNKYINVTPVLNAPVATFSASPRSGKVPLKVQFTDKSANSPTSWKWSFGDGKYSTQKNPAHTYSKAGKYDISLTVKNAKGSSTKKMSGYIVVNKK